MIHIPHGDWPAEEDVDSESPVVLSACGPPLTCASSLVRVCQDRSGYRRLEPNPVATRRLRWVAAVNLIVLAFLALAGWQAARKWPHVSLLPRSARAWMMRFAPGGARHQLARLWPENEADTAAQEFTENSTALRRHCCKDNTAACRACAMGWPVEDYCSMAKNSAVPGCRDQKTYNARPREALLLPKSECCIGNHAECFACKAGVPLADYCGEEENRNVAGCPEELARERGHGNRKGCCTAMKAQCLSCAAGQTLEEFCIDVKHADVMGCAGFCGFVEEDHNYPGGELYALSFLPSSDACCASCRAEPRCTSWSWNKRVGSPEYGRCSLKRQSELKREVNKNFTAGLPGRDDRLFQIKNHHSDCLDSDSDLGIEPCKGRWTLTQQWAYDREIGQVRTVHGECLTMLSESEKNEVAFRSCHASEPGQRWDFSSSSGHLRSTAEGGNRCLQAMLKHGEAVRVATAPCSRLVGSVQQWGLWDVEVLGTSDIVGEMKEETALQTTARKVRPTTTRPPATTTSTATTTTTTHSSFFCFAVMLPWGYEPSLLQMQFQTNKSIFACEEWAVYTSANMNLSGLKPTKLSIDLHCSLRGKFHTYYNTPIFIKIWRQVISDNRIHFHDWTVKVDPDAVFLPWRLRHSLANLNNGRLEAAEKQRGMFVNNCKYGLHGPMEVVSRRALDIYAEGVDTCERPPQEDVYLQSCLKSLGVEQYDNFDVLVEDHCDPPDEWTDCESRHAVFHPFKSVGAYKKCLHNAEQFRG
mmetsp:Transcript_70327/g.177236  ORF Transcript_70327/g.177236 Transcript_70327/m.177236 type:complete len:757 (-) Transcript_70327:89-2359(-)